VLCRVSTTLEIDLTGFGPLVDTTGGWRSLCRRFSLRPHPGGLAGTLRTSWDPSRAGQVITQLGPRRPAISLPDWSPSTWGLIKPQAPSRRSDLAARVARRLRFLKAFAAASSLSPKPAQRVCRTVFGCCHRNCDTTNVAVMALTGDQGASKSSRGARPAPGCRGRMTGQMGLAAAPAARACRRLAGLGSRRAKLTAGATRAGLWGRWRAPNANSRRSLAKV